MMEIKLTMINVQTPVKTRDAKMVFSKKVKNVMMKTMLMMMAAQINALCLHVEMEFSTNKKNNVMMAIKFKMMDALTIVITLCAGMESNRKANNATMETK